MVDGTVVSLEIVFVRKKIGLKVKPTNVTGLIGFIRQSSIMAWHGLYMGDQAKI